MADLDVLGVEGIFLLCTSLRVLRQGINSSVSLILITIDLEVVTKEFLGLADLPKAQILCVYEPEEVVVVVKREDFMSRAL